MKRLLLYQAAAACLLFFTGSIKAPGQEKTDYVRYMDAIKEKSIIYRGKEAPQYNFIYNGNPYWDGERFKIGELVFNDKHYSNLPLRIDAVTGELSVNLEGTSRAVIIESQAVPWCTMDGVKYINLRLSGFDTAAEGFYEVLMNGDATVLKRVVKSPAFSYNSQNDKGIGYYDREYKDNVFDYFEQKTYYYLIKDGHLSRISRRKAEKYAAQN